MQKTNRNYKGKKTPFSFDSRHGASAATTLHIHKNLNFSANWLFQTGRPFSPTEFSEGDIPSTVIDWLEISETSEKRTRLPNFHRLDLALNLHFGKNKWTHHFNFGMYNVYNRKNAASISFGQNKETGANEATRTAIFGIIPSVTYNFKF